jgi:starch phosphorylase
LKAILLNPERPVQIVFAGKAHPHDEQGKQLIRQIYALTKDESIRKQVVFLENYDMSISRQMVQGCDIWLNTPRRPLEACGTSGMKAAANGCLNVSVLDGWWDEAWQSASQNKTPIGWAIGRGEQYGSDVEQDAVEAEALYDLLEQDVIPEFYARRSRAALPAAWIARSQSAAAALCPVYNSHRMVREYVEECYIPSAFRSKAILANDIARAREVAQWKKRVTEAWPRVRIEVPRMDNMPPVRVGEHVPVIARVFTGGLAAEDLRVEAFIGPLDSRGEISSPEVTEMMPVGPGTEEILMYEVQAVLFDQSGRHGFTVRATPRHPDVTNRFLPGLIAWAVPAPEGNKK